MPTIPSVTETDEITPGSVYLETAIEDGNKKTVARDERGSLVYHSYLPPNVESPTLSSAIDRDSAQPPIATRPRKTESDPIPATVAADDDNNNNNNNNSASHRPPLDKKWPTDAPQYGSRRPAILPALPKRAGTSYLDRAIWESSRDDGNESMSESSDDDDDDDDDNDHNDHKKSEGIHNRSRKSDTSQKDKKGGKKRSAKRVVSDGYKHFRVGNDSYHTKGRVKRDGRLRITVEETAGTGYLAKALGAAIKKVCPSPKDEKKDKDKECKRESASPNPRPITSRISSDATVAASSSARKLPRLNIVIMVIGSRGDAQPFLKIGKVLKEEHGHRVRIATHPAFRDFVERDSGLEFFSVGGDPSELMAFMVKNPGMIPTLETVKAGDIGRRRAAMAEMFNGFWRACINATDDEKDVRNLKMMGERDPFVADAIIANPPSFAHVHCAEALGIPLHMMFTFPYTPTQAFPHPLASIKKSNIDPGYTNFISYPLTEMMVWQGLGDLVNHFRVSTLALDPISTLWAPGTTYRLHVPFSYLWSPGLVPKPADWGDEVDVTGFVFLDLASSFQPPAELSAFLAAGSPPVYIGFGSIVVDDADRFTEMIFEAVRLAGVRALVSKGWGGLGQDVVPDGVFMLENTPHDWLFPRVEACVIHGGAGTTAIALKCAKPTMIVPFFGDQHFWGNMVADSGAGPTPVPYKRLTAEKLAEGIRQCLEPEAKEAARRIAGGIDCEGDGARNAVRSFHRQVAPGGRRSMRCSILPDRVAVWTPKNSHIGLSPLAADILVDRGLVSWKQLRFLRHMEWNDFEGPGEPITGVAGSIAGTVGGFFGGIGRVPYRMAKTTKKRREKRERKQARSVAAAATRKVPRQTTVVGDPATATTASSSGATTTTTDGPGMTDYFDQVKIGVEQSASALAHAPVDLSLALAQGFHNAPKIYGDDTVRRPMRVTGFRSGLRAARFEFAYGIYDGWTGVVRLPYRGARKDGVGGFCKGVVMGMTGFVLKDLAALIGPFAYTMKGIAKQAERSRQPIRLIRRARIVQGHRELMAIDQAARAEVEQEVYEGWDVFRQLTDAIEQPGGRKRGLVGQVSSIFSPGLPGAFESVERARQTLDALRGGESIEDVLDEEKARIKEEKRQSEEAARMRSQEANRQSQEATAKKQRSLESTRHNETDQDRRRSWHCGKLIKRPKSNLLDGMKQTSSGDT